jgi:acetyl esterase/lipase
VIGNKEQQGKPMLLHLARRGYIGVSINYRLAPRHRWPAQIVDVKRALAWVHEHIAENGGDASFVAVSGASAGGHLAMLAALTPGEVAWQPGFEAADTSVDACIPIYAPFDLTDRAGIRGRGALRRFLEPMVMTTALAADTAGWRAASPVWRVAPGMPPCFVVQGCNDTLVLREESQHFVDELALCTHAPLVYAEVPGAQHAFEVFNSVRSRAFVDAVARFLDAVRRTAA